jgi:hypothetical protein
MATISNPSLAKSDKSALARDANCFGTVAFGQEAGVPRTE